MFCGCNHTRFGIRCDLLYLHWSRKSQENLLPRSFLPNVVNDSPKRRRRSLELHGEGIQSPSQHVFCKLRLIGRSVSHDTDSMTKKSRVLIRNTDFWTTGLRLHVNINGTSEQRKHPGPRRSLLRIVQAGFFVA